MNNTIPSEHFDQSYCIFVGAYNDNVLNYLNEVNTQAIKLLKATFKNDLYCIVIPSHYPFKKIESNLFKLYEGIDNPGGFWGQLGMGYKEKTWEVIA